MGATASTPDISGTNPFFVGDSPTTITGCISNPGGNGATLLRSGYKISLSSDKKTISITFNICEIIDNISGFMMFYDNTDASGAKDVSGSDLHGFITDPANPIAFTKYNTIKWTMKANSDSPYVSDTFNVGTIYHIYITNLPFISNGPLWVLYFTPAEKFENQKTDIEGYDEGHKLVGGIYHSF